MSRPTAATFSEQNGFCSQQTIWPDLLPSFPVLHKDPRYHMIVFLVLEWENNLTADQRPKADTYYLGPRWKLSTCAWNRSPSDGDDSVWILSWVLGFDWVPCSSPMCATLDPRLIVYSDWPGEIVHCYYLIKPTARFGRVLDIDGRGLPHVIEEITLYRQMQYPKHRSISLRLWKS